MSGADEDLAADILRGAEELAQFLFGDKGQRRKVYHLAATSNLPVFKLGSMICARKSILVSWIAEQESRHAGEGRKRA
ncbi:MAG: hypothetical protein WDN04_14305 [Rhodospirillales bacterium]